MAKNKSMAVKEVSAQYRVSTNLCPKGYKHTEVGIIPDDWDVKEISDLAEVIRGASPRPKGDKRYYGGNIPRLMVQDVTRDGKYVTPKIDFLTEAGAKLSRPCSKGTLTLVCSGTVGVPSILAVDACIHDGFLGLIKLSKKVDRNYLYQFFKTQLEKFDNSATHGGVFTNLTTNGVREFLVPTPPTVEEQTTIAEALSDVDVLITALEKLIAKKRAIKTATMQQLLTGKKRLPGFSGVWEETVFGEIVGHIIGGGTPSRANHNYWGDDIPWVTVKDFSTFNPFGAQEYVTKEGLKNSSSNLIPAGKVIIATRMAIGKPVIYQVDVCINQDMKAIFPKSDSSDEFIYYWFQYYENEIGILSGGSTVKGLSLPDLRSFVFYKPKYEEQEAIAKVLSDMDNEISELEARQNKTKAIKQGMMQELLTGRTRLI